MASGCNLIIQYTSDRPTEHHTLPNGRYSVGSSFVELDINRGEVPLTGRDISAIQFIVGPDATQEHWYIEPIGTTETFLGDRKIGHGGDSEQIEIRNGQFIQVPGARIHFHLIGSVDNLTSRAAIDACIHLQDRIHDQIFEELALESSSPDLDQETHAAQQRLLDAIQRRASELLSTASDEILKAAVSTAVRFAVLRSIAGSSIDESISTKIDGGPQRPGQLKARAGDLVRRLDLKLIKQSVEADTLRVDMYFEEVMEDEYKLMPLGDRRVITQWFMASNVWNAIYNFGPITELMDLEMVTEVMVVRYDCIYIERFDKLEQYPYSFSTPDRLMVILKRLVNRDGREIDRTNAMVDFKLPDGSRVNAIIEPLSRNGPCVTIRRHRKEQTFTLDLLSNAFQSLSPGMAYFLEACVRARKNIIVSGGTGSGKTTLLNALSGNIPNGQRVITIEDTAELTMANEHVVSLESRPPNAEGEGEVDIRKLVKNALRMRPDRIIVGECRGGEAVDMLQALNTGHAGSMTTAHANGPAELLMRLEVMVLQGEPNLPVHAIRNQITSAVDLIVQLQKVPLPSETGRGKKLVTDIAEVIGIHPVSGDIIVESIFTFSGFGLDDTPIHMFSGYLPSFIEEVDACRGVFAEGEKAGQRIPLEDFFVMEAAE